MERLAFGIPNRQVQHLVEIAIVDRPFPADTDETSAHHLVEGRGIKTPFQKLHIFSVLAAQFEVRLVTRDRHVAETIEMIELDAEPLQQLPSVILLKFRLRRR